MLTSLVTWRSTWQPHNADLQLHTSLHQTLRRSQWISVLYARAPEAGDAGLEVICIIAENLKKTQKATQKRRKNCNAVKVHDSMIRLSSLSCRVPHLTFCFEIYCGQNLRVNSGAVGDGTNNNL